MIALQRATQPLVEMLEGLLRGAEKYKVHSELQPSLRDVHDHTLRITDRAATLRSLLDNALTVNATLVSERQSETALIQSEQVKKISGWAAILFGPTLVGTVYGMNFDIYARTRLGLRLPDGAGPDGRRPASRSTSSSERSTGSTPRRQGIRHVPVDSRAASGADARLPGERPRRIALTARALSPRVMARIREISFPSGRPLRTLNVIAVGRLASPPTASRTPTKDIQ